MKRLLAIIISALMISAIFIANAGPASATSVRYKTCHDYSNREFILLTESNHDGYSAEWSRRLSSTQVRIVLYTPIIVREVIYATSSDSTWTNTLGPGAWAITINASLGHFWSSGSVGTGATWYDSNSWYWYSDGTGPATVGQNHCATPQIWIS